MFGFGTSKRQSVQGAERTKLIGVDMTASRARAIAIAGGHANPIPFESTNDELPLFINLEPRTPEIGRSGYAIARKHPHLVCSNYLPQIGQAREWRGTRVTMTPESALIATFAKLRGPIAAESDGFTVALPSYLVAPQVKAFRELAIKQKLPLIGTSAAPLALAAHRAASILKPRKATESNDENSWVVPIRPQDPGPGDLVLIDVDEYALSMAVVNVQPSEVRTMSLLAWPKLSQKAWKDRLIDALSDRCVRLCRRDPRDSADAEQALFEQLDRALDTIRHARPVTLTIRGEKWYQDLIQQPTDFESHCAPLLRTAEENLKDALTNANRAGPPRAVWLTDSAAKLPGLAANIFRISSEQTEVAVLPPDAAAEAAASLHARWQVGNLPRVHLDGLIALEAKPKAVEPRAQKSV